MKHLNTYLTILVFCIALQIQAQSEIEVRYESNDYINWNNKYIVDANGQIFDDYESRPSYGISYRYKIQPDKERQVIYYAGLGYSTNLANEAHYKISAISVGTGVRFFPFNMNADCDCPSFYQEGNLFSRGFFLSLGVSGASVKIYNQDSKIQALAEATAGVSIPISKTLNLQPFIGFAFGTGIVNQNLAPDPNPISTLNQLRFGLQFSLQRAKRR